VRGRCVTAPGGAALLARTITRGVAAHRRSVGSRHAVSFAAVRVLSTGRAEQGLARHDALAQAVTGARARLARRPLRLIERRTFDLRLALTKRRAVLLQLRLVITAALRAASTHESPARRIGRRRAADSGAALCRAGGAQVTAA
jgi:hypothetical protein